MTPAAGGWSLDKTSPLWIAFSARRGWIGIALSGLVALAAWLTPLTDHLGFGAALIAAAVSSAIACFWGAGFPHALVRGGARASAGEVLTASGAYGVSLVVLFGLVTFAHGLINSACKPGEGSLFFLLISLPGAVLAALVGLGLGASLRRRWVASALACMVVPGFIVWSLVRFYNSPAIFAYDPFFGFFPGTLYDETISLDASLVTYRLGTLGAIVASAGLIAWLWDPSEHRMRFAVRSRRIPALVVSATGAVVTLGIYLAGPALGHRHGSDDIARTLGGRIDGPRCAVIYARAINARQARLTRNDCQVRLAQLESFFGVTVRSKVTVFLFADAEQKRQLMGAAETYIAKPWRHEAYLQYAPFPHPVLKHEIAHLVAGEMAGGPFHVSNRNGLIPLPGLIEGAAVAAGWEGEGDSSPHQWSRAMLEAGLAPSMAQLAGPGFFTHAAGKAYTAAGSFSRWLIEHYGSARFREVYRHGDFERAYGRPAAVLEREWHAFLRTVPVPERLLTRARTRFRRAAMIARVCPYETADLYDRASAHLLAGDLSRARSEFVRVVANDPTDVHARVSLAETYARLGQVSQALHLADEASRDLGVAAGARLRLRVGDTVWRWNGPDAARAVFGSIDPSLFDEDDARTLEIKRWVLGGNTQDTPDPAYALALRDLLVGQRETDPSALAAVTRLALGPRAEPNGTTPNAMAGYLIARLLLASDRGSEAAALLAGSDLSRLPTERVRAEARRVWATAMYLAGDRSGALARFETLAGDSARPQGVRDVAADWVDRIRRETR